jgi:hypothetical protein
MIRSAVILGLLGAEWMAVIVCSGSLRLAIATDYPGLVAANMLVRSRGIVPSVQMVWLFNACLILSSALLWIGVGLLVRAIIKATNRHPLDSHSLERHCYTS